MMVALKAVWMVANLAYHLVVKTAEWLAALKVEKLVALLAGGKVVLKAA